MNVSPELLTPLGIMALLLILVIGPIVKKLDINKLFNRTKQIDKRQLTNDEISLIENHDFYVEISNVIQRKLKKTYFNSKKGFPQKIFTLFTHYFLVVLKEDISIGVGEIIYDKNKSANVVVTDLEKMNLQFIRHFNEHTDFIPTVLKNKFIKWYDDNFNWYYESIDSVIMEHETYYSNIDDYLKLSLIFINALMNNVTETIDLFNGDISEFEHLLSQSDNIFKKINYLND